MKTKNIKFSWIWGLFLLLPLVLLSDDLDTALERPIGGKEKLRIISYNILEGFNYKRDTDRMNRMVEWIRVKSPDILALQELNSYSSAELSALAKRWGHPYSALVKERRGCPVGITSKYPIEVVDRVISRLWHGLLHVKIRGFDILVTHLDPRNWENRRKEAIRITTYARRITNDKILLMGDLNCHSPIDADNLENNATDIRPIYYTDPNMVDGRELDFSTISTFLSYPLYDLCWQFVPAEKRITFPTAINRHQPKSPTLRHRRSRRIDFIFGSLAVRKMTAEGFIMNGRETDYLSDHYPVGVDLVF